MEKSRGIKVVSSLFPVCFLGSKMERRKNPSFFQVYESGSQQNGCFRTSPAFCTEFCLPLCSLLLWPLHFDTASPHLPIQGTQLWFLKCSRLWKSPPVMVNFTCPLCWSMVPSFRSNTKCCCEGIFRCN